MSDERVSRRTMLGGAVALVGLGVGLATTTAPRVARADDAADAAALNAVLQRSYEMVRVYDAAIGFVTGMADGGVVGALFTHFRAQVRDGAARLVAGISALGGAPIAEGSVAAPPSPAGFTRTVANYVKYASNLTKVAASDHATRVRTLGSQGAAELVAAIVGTLSQQFTVLYLFARGIAGPGAMAATMLTEIVPRSFVAVRGAPAQSLTTVPDLTFTV